MKTFQLLRGKSNDEVHADSEDRIIGKFKVSSHVKWVIIWRLCIFMHILGVSEMEERSNYSLL